jgi:hypothetical protein
MDVDLAKAANVTDNDLLRRLGNVSAEVVENSDGFVAGVGSQCDEDLVPNVTSQQLVWHVNGVYQGVVSNGMDRERARVVRKQDVAILIKT